MATATETLEWLAELGTSPEFRVNLAMEGYGSDEDAAERLLDSLINLVDEFGPVVSLDSDNNSISATMSFPLDLHEALDCAYATFVAAVHDADLERGRICGAAVEYVPARERTVPS